jgi:hypothetical protein
MLQKSFWGGERKFSEPLMRLPRGEVRDHIVSSKIDHGLRSGAEKRRSGREVQRSTLARYSGLFDFRLLQQYRHLADVTTVTTQRDVRLARRVQLVAATHSANLSAGV